MPPRGRLVLTKTAQKQMGKGIETEVAKLVGPILLKEGAKLGAKIVGQKLIKRALKKKGNNPFFKTTKLPIF